MNPEWSYPIHYKWLIDDFEETGAVFGMSERSCGGVIGHGGSHLASIVLRGFEGGAGAGLVASLDHIDYQWVTVSEIFLKVV